MRNRRWCEMDRRRREDGVTGRHRVRMRWGNWGRTDRLRASRGDPKTDRQMAGTRGCPGLPAFCCVY